MNSPSLKNDCPIIDGLADFETDADEDRLQALLEEYADAIDRNRDSENSAFQREEWLDRVCADNRDLAVPIREGAEQIDALTRLAIGCEQGLHPAPKIDGYRVIGRLGQGGAGIVYKAIDEELQREVALKVYPGVIDSESKAYARFMIEGQAAARLDHPHIVPVFRVGETRDSVRYLAMRLIDGQSLDQLLIHGKPSVADTVTWGVHAAEAIAHAHQCGVIHRDIKPSNLLVDHQNRIWVSDFGLARIDASTGHRVSVTATGDRVGTFAYMSPQQAAGEPVDERTDVYSLGLTLFELLTGRRAIVGQSIQAVQASRLQTDGFHIRAIDRTLPLELDKVIAKATAIDAAERYQDITALAEDLKRFKAGNPVLATIPSPLYRATKWITRHRRIASSLVFVSVIVALVSWAFAAKLSRANQDAKRALMQSQADLRSSEEILDQFGLVAAERLRHVDGARSIRRELLQTSLRYYQNHLKRISGDSRYVLQSAISYFKTAQIVDEIGSSREAADGYQRSIMHFQNADDRSPSSDRIYGLCLNNLAVLKSESGLLIEAERLYRDAIDIQTRLANEQHPSEQSDIDLARTHGNFAMVLMESSREAEAINQLQQGLNILKFGPGATSATDVVRAMLLSSLAHVTRKTSAVQARETNERAIVSLRKCLKDFSPEDQGLRWSDTCRMLATALANRATLNVGNPGENRPGVALESLSEANQLLTGIAEVSGSNRAFLAQWATVNNNEGRLLFSQGHLIRALERFETARRLLTRLAESDPSAQHYRASLAGVLHNLGRAFEQKGESVAAQKVIRDAMRLQTELLSESDGMDHSVKQSRRQFLDRTTAMLNRLDSTREEDEYQ